MGGFDLGKQRKESKGLDPATLRSYFQAAGRGSFRILAQGPSKAHAETWKKEDIDGPNPEYEEGGYVVIRVDKNDADDFDSTNVIVIGRNDESDFAVEGVKILEHLEAQNAANQEATAGE